MLGQTSAFLVENIGTYEADGRAIHSIEDYLQFQTLYSTAARTPVVICIHVNLTTRHPKHCWRRSQGSRASCLTVSSFELHCNSWRSLQSSLKWALSEKKQSMMVMLKVSSTTNLLLRHSERQGEDKSRLCLKNECLLFSIEHGA